MQRWSEGPPSRSTRRASQGNHRHQLDVLARTVPVAAEGLRLRPRHRPPVWAASQRARGTAAHRQPATPPSSGPGMVVSNEPGYYKGRLLRQSATRTCLLVKECGNSPVPTAPMYGFRALTLVPFDRGLLEPALRQPRRSRG